MNEDTKLLALNFAIFSYLMPTKRLYNEEYYKVDNTDLYISGGLGSKGVNLRYFNKPSINFYRIVTK